MKLHIDDSVKPVAQHVRRIPLGLWEEVDKTLDELLELDIIEGAPDGHQDGYHLLLLYLRVMET